jgi:hypothetical protein
MSNNWLVYPRAISDRGQLEERIRTLNTYFHGGYVALDTLCRTVQEGVCERRLGLHTDNPRYGVFLQLATRVAKLHRFPLEATS